jgi:hypothetical protein
VSSLLIALTLLLTASASTAEITATKLDGTSLVGSLQGWTDSRCVLATTTGTENIPENELLSLQWSPLPRPGGALQPQVELVEGSALPLDEYTSADGSAHLILRHSGPLADRTNDVPIDQVRAVWLRPIEERLTDQRDEIRALNLPSDLLVIFKQNGRSLDYVEGVVGEITDSEVEFTLDDKPMRIQRSKVAGVVYYRGDRADDQTSACVLLGRYGLNAQATQVQLVGTQLQFVTAGQLELTWPLADVYKADFSAGKVLFLTDLQPASERWSPWVGLPQGAKLAARYGQPHRDESSDGGPLSLWIPNELPPASGDVQTYEKGLSLRSRTDISYRLPRGFHRFLAVTGIEPTTNHNGDVRLIIDGDGRQLWTGRVAGGQAPQPIDLDIEGVKRLTIVVDYGDNLDTGDWLNLCNARIVK